MTANRATYAILAHHHHHPRILIRRIRAGSDAPRAALDGRPSLPAPRQRVSITEKKRGSSLGLSPRSLRKQVVQRSELLFPTKIDCLRFPREGIGFLFRKLAFPDAAAIWACLKKKKKKEKKKNNGGAKRLPVRVVSHGRSAVTARAVDP